MTIHNQTPEGRTFLVPDIASASKLLAGARQQRRSHPELRHPGVDATGQFVSLSEDPQGKLIDLVAEWATDAGIDFTLVDVPSPTAPAAPLDPVDSIVGALRERFPDYSVVRGHRNEVYVYGADWHRPSVEICVEVGEARTSVRGVFRKDVVGGVASEVAYDASASTSDPNSVTRHVSRAAVVLAARRAADHARHAASAAAETVAREDLTMLLSALAVVPGLVILQSPSETAPIWAVIVEAGQNTQLRITRERDGWSGDRHRWAVDLSSPSGQRYAVALSDYEEGGDRPLREALADLLAMPEADDHVPEVQRWLDAAGLVITAE